MTHNAYYTVAASRPSRAWLVAATTVLIAVLSLGPDVASAQPQKPLKMTFVDATPNTSAAIHDKLRSVIERSDDINFTNPSDFLYNAQNFDITLDTLSSANQRKSQKELIRRAMRANDLETIVIYKRKGNNLHLILLGPSGAQLEHYRSPIRQPRINDRQAIAVLKKIFKVVVPKVRRFRQRNPNAGQASPQPQPGGPGTTQSGGPSGSGKKNKSKNKSGGRLASKVNISAAPIFGTRSLVINTEQTDGILRHGTPIFGGGIQLDTIFGLVDAKSSALGASGFVEFAPFRTKFRRIQKTPRGTYFRSGARLRYFSAVSSTVTLFGQVGGESLNIGLSSNSIYVGSTYFALSAGAGATFRFSDVVDLTVDADAMPTLLTNTNDGAFGDGGFSVGFSGGAKLRWRVFSPWFLAASYDFQLFSPDHPNPTLDDYGGPASGTDVLHIGGVAAGYKF